MANFHTHLIVGSTASGLIATGLLGASVATPREVVLYFTVGTVGGLLPDVDSDNSVLLRVIFTIVAVLGSFFIMFTQVNGFSIAELLILWTFSFLVFNYGIFRLFKEYTHHRGIFHSVPAAIFAGLLSAGAFYHFLDYSPLIAWSSGLFMFLGYMVHLCLDEIFSVDLSNRKIKKSFGSALKFIAPKNVVGSILIYLLILGSFTAVPPADTFINTMIQRSTYENFKRNFFPRDENWFKRD